MRSLVIRVEQSEPVCSKEGLSIKSYIRDQISVLNRLISIQPSSRIIKSRKFQTYRSKDCTTIIQPLLDIRRYTSLLSIKTPTVLAKCPLRGWRERIIYKVLPIASAMLMKRFAKSDNQTIFTVLTAEAVPSSLSSVIILDSEREV